ncbi:hypothetical protein AB0J84_18010 [Micromonospora arborensis]|uniref:hypothetical protein n=1 Tax=Micromonospora arborensis TaxID=2116518 RepID=UPI00341318D5
MNRDNVRVPYSEAWWVGLDPQLQDRIDELLCVDRLVAAVVLLRREGQLHPLPGLYEAQDMLMRRRRELDSQGLVAPKAPPLTTAELIELAAAVTAPVVAVEAVWNGDTQGWFVDLVAIVQPVGQHHDEYDEMSLTCLSFGTDVRLFTGEVPPWPEAVQATEQGRAVAQHLGVPFHFSSPTAPDEDLSRWWDSQPHREATRR